jgi:hypothetical protein
MNSYKIQFKSTRDTVRIAFGITWKKNQKEEIFTFPSGARLFANFELPFFNTILFTIMEPSYNQNPFLEELSLKHICNGKLDEDAYLDEVLYADNNAVMDALKYTIHIVSTKEYFKEVQFRVMTKYSNY